SSSTTSDSALKGARTKTLQEYSHDPPGTDRPPRSRAALQLPGAAEPLGRRGFLSLSDVDRTGLLVSLVVLDRCHLWGRAGLSHASSVGWLDFHRSGDLHVWDVEKADAIHGSRPAMVEIAALLHHQ